MRNEILIDKLLSYLKLEKLNEMQPASIEAIDRKVKSIRKRILTSATHLLRNISDQKIRNKKVKRQVTR